MSFSESAYDDEYPSQQSIPSRSQAYGGRSKQSRVSYRTKSSKNRSGREHKSECEPECHITAGTHPGAGVGGEAAAAAACCLPAQAPLTLTCPTPVLTGAAFLMSSIPDTTVVTPGATSPAFAIAACTTGPATSVAIFDSASPGLGTVVPADGTSLPAVGSYTGLAILAPGIVYLAGTLLLNTTLAAGSAPPLGYLVFVPASLTTAPPTPIPLDFIEITDNGTFVYRISAGMASSMAMVGPGRFEIRFCSPSGATTGVLQVGSIFTAIEVPFPVTSAPLSLTCPGGNGAGSSQFSGFQLPY